jgi:peptide-methionine (R)-S-oxide reductase
VQEWQESVVTGKLVTGCRELRQHSGTTDEHYARKGAVAMKTFSLLCSLFLIGLAAGMSPAAATDKIKVYSVQERGFIMTEKVEKSAAEWRRMLTPEQYQILREKGTERAFTGAYDKHHEQGTYRCAGCGLDLFASTAKFNSGTGWPSFYAPVAAENLTTEDDVSFFSRRTELLCARCGGHLGHVFEDGPKPTGLRYCINSAALTFVAGK